MGVVGRMARRRCERDSGSPTGLRRGLHARCRKRRRRAAADAARLQRPGFCDSYPPSRERCGVRRCRGGDSIELAVVRLGTRAVRNAVLAACLSAWAQAIDVYGRRAVDDIQHAVGTACLARRLAERLRIVADEAFVHGLLHDVGKLFLLKMRAEYLRLGGRSPSAEEFDGVMTSRHAEIGATALQLWGLPESVREPVRWHHEPFGATSQARAAAVTYLANRLSHRYGFGCPPDGRRRWAHRRSRLRRSRTPWRMARENRSGSPSQGCRRAPPRQLKLGCCVAK